MLGMFTETRVVLHVLWPFCCPILTKIGMSLHILVKLPDIKFNENPFSGSQVVTFGQMDGQTDMVKLINVCICQNIGGSCSSTPPILCCLQETIRS